MQKHAIAAQAATADVAGAAAREALADAGLAAELDSGRRMGSVRIGMGSNAGDCFCVQGNCGALACRVCGGGVRLRLNCDG